MNKAPVDVQMHVVGGGVHQLLGLYLGVAVLGGMWPRLLTAVAH